MVGSGEGPWEVGIRLRRAGMIVMMRVALLACHVHVTRYLRIQSPQTRFAFRQIDANVDKAAEETRLFGIGPHGSEAPALSERSLNLFYFEMASPILNRRMRLMQRWYFWQRRRAGKDCVWAGWLIPKVTVD